MERKVILWLIVVALSSIDDALAWQPTPQVLSQLVGDPVDLGGGLTGWTLGVDVSLDGQALSVYSALSIEGNNLVQRQPLPGLNVDLEQMAAAFDGQFGYDRRLDSYWKAGPGTPWSVAVPPYFGVDIATGMPGSNLYRASFGTAPSTPVSGRSNIAYIVTDAASGEIRVSGETARRGVSFVHDSVTFATMRPVLTVDPNPYSPEYYLPYVERIGRETAHPFRVSAYNTGAPGLSGTVSGATGDFYPAGTTSFGPLDRNELVSREFTFRPTHHGVQSQDIVVSSNGGDHTYTVTAQGVGPEFVSDPAPNSVLWLDPVNQPQLRIETANESPDPAGYDSLTQLVYEVLLSGPDAGAFHLQFPSERWYLSVGQREAIDVQLGAFPYGIESRTRILEALVTVVTDQEGLSSDPIDGRSFEFHLRALVPEPSGIVWAMVGALGLFGSLVGRRFRPPHSRG